MKTKFFGSRFSLVLCTILLYTHPHLKNITSSLVQIVYRTGKTETPGSLAISFGVPAYNTTFPQTDSVHEPYLDT